MVCLGVQSWAPLLFVVYINDVDENVHGMISKCDDDTKISVIVESEDVLMNCSGILII